MLKLTLPAILIMLAAQTASAALIVRAADATINSAGASFFDVYVELTGPELATPPNVSGWQLNLALSPASSGVQFTSIGAPTAPHDNIFPGETPFGFVTGADVQAVNFLPMAGDFTTFADGSGLLRVFVNVDPGTVGVFDVTIDPLSVEITDENGQPLDFEIDNGVLTINAPTGQSPVIPEPLSGAMGMMSALLCLRRHRATRQSAC